MHYIQDSPTPPFFCTLHSLEWTFMDLKYLVPQVFWWMIDHQPGSQMGFSNQRCQSHCNASEILHVWEVAGMPVGKFSGCVIFKIVIKYG